MHELGLHNHNIYMKQFRESETKKFWKKILTQTRKCLVFEKHAFKVCMIKMSGRQKILFLKRNLTVLLTFILIDTISL